MSGALPLSICARVALLHRIPVAGDPDNPGVADEGFDVGKSLANIPAVQARVGEAAGCINAGRLIIKTDLEKNLATVNSGRQISVAERICCKRNQAIATRIAVNAATALYRVPAALASSLKIEFNERGVTPTRWRGTAGSTGMCK